MATSTNEYINFPGDISIRSENKTSWLKSKYWDLSFIIFSIVLVPIPYLGWIILGKDSVARQVINFSIAVLIGGPHMMATFSRTTFDTDFRSKYPKFILSSFVIPVIVVSLALFDMSVLLTVFFSVAAIHVIHQASFIIESYNRKERDPFYQDKAINGQRMSWKESLTNPYHLIDFFVVSFALFPVATYRMVQHDFTIGQISLNNAIPNVFEQMWTVYLTSFIFAIAFFAFIIKSVLEIMTKTLNLPKFLFILATSIALFVGPMFGNLDTSFQGINVWHSFQYLALTWYVNKLRMEKGQMEKFTFFNRISGDGKLKLFYGFNLALTFSIGIVILVIFLILQQVGGIYSNSSYAFEVAYYIGVLSILWQHYYHDHFLFTQTDSLVP